QSGHSYDVGALALFFFEVVFMETAGYIIVGAIAERINFKTFIVAELLLGAIIYPIYGNWLWGGGWLSQIGHSWNLGHGAVVFAGVAAMAFTAFIYGKPDISMSCNGMLAGLVAITAPCAFVAPWSAALIGFTAGVIVCGGVWFWDNVAKVDDPCGAISVHGLC